MHGIVKRLFSWKCVAAVVAICLLSISPVSAYVPVPMPTDEIAVVQDLGDDPVVFVTRTGSAYHGAGCVYLSRSARPIRLSAAARSYRPCTACRPPVVR